LKGDFKTLASEIATVDEGEGIHLVENLSKGSVVADGLAFAIMGECVFEEQGFAWCFRCDNFGGGLAFFSAWTFHGGGEKEGEKGQQAANITYLAQSRNWGLLHPAIRNKHKLSTLLKNRGSWYTMGHRSLGPVLFTP